MLREVGTPRDFAPRASSRATTSRSASGCGAIDTERGAKVSGARFYFLTGIGARLELALLNCAIDQALAAGFTPVITPTLVKPEIMAGTGFLGAHADEVYHLASRRPLPRRHQRGGARRLPRRRDPRPVRRPAALRRLVGLLPPRGRLVRQGHPRHHPRAPVPQGRDVRLVPRRGRRRRAPPPARAGRRRCCALVELPYRVIDVAAGDLGSSAARKFDCEAWVPTQDRYRELTSTSNCTTFQARRLDVRERTRTARGGQPARRDAQRHARHDALDRRAAREPPAARRLGARPGGAAAVPRGLDVLEAPWSRSRRRRCRSSPSTSTGRSSTTTRRSASVSARRSAACVDAGHHVVVATGRSLPGTLPVLDRLGLTEGWCVCSNGGVTLRLDPALPDGYEIAELVTFDPAPGAARCSREHLPTRAVRRRGRRRRVPADRAVPAGRAVRRPRVRRLRGAARDAGHPGHRPQPRAHAAGLPARSSSAVGLHGVELRGRLDRVARPGARRRQQGQRAGAGPGRASACSRTRTLAVGDGRNDVEMLRVGRRVGRDGAGRRRSCARWRTR